MQRKELPRRSTRGQKPQLNPIEIAEENEFYNKVFGVAAISDSQGQQEDKKQQARQARKDQMAKNFPNYSYSRAHHYYFDLHTFPRVEGHPSYAVDQQNIFGWSFSKEQKAYQGTPLSKIINRKYFGLPHTINREKEKDQSKNVCHSVLFQGEDKKYNLQRLLYTCKKIDKRLQNYVQTGNIKNFRSIVKKQPQLQMLSSSKASLSEKREALQKIIRNSESKKQINREAHQYEDKLHFHFSLNQKFHNQFAKIQENISLSLIPLTIYSNQMKYLSIIKQNPQYLLTGLKHILKFHLSSISAVSDEKIEQLVLKHKRLLLTWQQDKPIVNLPCQLFYFGPQSLTKIVDNIISMRISKVHGDLGYYTAKFAWTKLFKRDLIQFKVPPKQNYAQYKVKMQAFAESLKDYLAKEAASEFCENKNIFDDQINLEQLEILNQQQVTFLNQNNLIQINEKQLLIITLYSWICNSVSKIYPVIEQTTDYPTVFSAQHFNKHYLNLLQVINQPYFGVFNSALQLLIDSITKSGPFFDLKINLYFDYNSSNRTGVIWKKNLANDSSNWESVGEFQQVEEDQNLKEEEQLQNQGNIPNKKIKNDIDQQQ